MHDEHDALDEELVDRIRTYAEAAEEAVSVPAAIAKFDLPPTAGDAVAELLDGEAPASRERPGESKSAVGDSSIDVSYRELYLEAWDRSDADQALVPHEDVAPVFREAGLPELIRHGGLPRSEWTVWTPESRDTPLYAYTPDLAGDTSAERTRLAELLEAADVGTERFIDVLDGQKASFDTPNHRAPDDPELSGNYGVKGGRLDEDGLWLVDIDVDDYDEAKESNPRVEDLRGSTLGVASAHTTTDRPGHLYVAVDGDAAGVVRDLLGRDVDNPAASFGEIRIKEQYVVGPGSRIVCGCPKCSDEDAPEHYGRYELATERPPVVWTESEFREFLEADPAIEPGEADSDDARHDAHEEHDGARSDQVSFTGDADARVAFAATVDEYVADAVRDARNPDDRSKADAALARSVAPWVEYDRDKIRDVLNDKGTGKWEDRGSGYRQSILNYAADRPVDGYDPVPYWALVEVAVADGLLEREDLVERDSETGEVVADDVESDTYEALPSGTYGDVLEHVRDEYGVEPGRTAPSHTGYNPEDAEPVAVLPNTPVDRADQFGILRADRRDGGDPMQERRDRTAEEIERVYRSGDRALVEALPTLGKTYGAVKAAAESNTQVSIFTTRGRKEQYAEIKRVCEEHGLEPLVLPAFTHDCETANGTHGEEIAETVRGWYHSGATPKQIHKYAEDVLGKPLPCHADGRRCSYAAKWDFDPDEFDVLIGHYAHAHKRKATQGRAVVFDEFPGGAFETTLAGEHELAGAVSTFLDRTPQVPYEDFADLIEGRHLDAERRSDALAFLVDDLEPDPHEAFDGRSGHAYAPLVVFTLLASDDLGNGWEAATFPDGGRIGLYDRSNNRVHIRTAPNLKFASSVAALDGTPTKELWELALDERLNHRPVLQEGEREEYLDDVLGLNIVRTTEAVKPYAGGEYVNTDQDLALLEAIADRHDTAPGVISSRSALDQYAEAGALEFDPEDGSVTDGPADRVKWYGNVLGSNEFKRTRVGAVIGSNHYGDGFIQKWGAYAGEAVERGDEKGAALSYGSFGDKVLTHMREHETLQATMRFGRDGKGATVYVHTDTLPEWVPTAGEGRVINTWSDGMKQVLEAADDLGATFRTAELVDHPDVEIGRRQVFDHLATLAERGYLDREHEGRGYTWRDDGLHRVNDHGDTELEPVDVDDLDGDGFRELARSSVNTWEFTNPPGVKPDPSPQRPGEASVAATSAGNGGDRGDHEPE